MGKDGIFQKLTLQLLLHVKYSSQKKKKTISQNIHLQQFVLVH